MQINKPLMHPTKTEAQQRLIAAYTAFLALAEPLSEVAFTQQLNGKWSVADTAQHLYLSARNLSKMLNGPRLFFDQWPVSGRLSKPYSELKVSYDSILGAGLKAPASLSPRPDDMQLSKPELLTRFSTAHQLFADALEGWSEEELDQYQLPHPALGLITIREMAYFTAYHITHHQQIVF